jgi:putative transposase
MNRAPGRVTLFRDDGDYAAFERVLAEAVARFAVRLCAYCLMPNHWHLVLWPRKDNELSRFMQWLTMTHTQRLHARRRSAGRGHVYQGRFKSFPAQRDEHYLTLCRYVERNALRANLVRRAQDWRWCSLWRRGASRGELPDDGLVLSGWPVERPADWPAWVNRPETAAELEAVRGSARRGRPYGSDAWARATAARLGAESSLRPPGRPRKQGAEGEGKVKS